MNRPLVIWHSGCQDGFTSAWIVDQALDHDVDFHAGIYQDPPPDVTDRVVYMVDFSYKRSVVMEMAKVASSITILDHHKSAIEDLAGIALQTADAGDVVTVFDLERSGAGITWDYFFDPNSRPWLVNYVEDRDLFRFKYPHTRNFSARLFAEEYDFGEWSRVDFIFNGANPVEAMRFLNEGAAINMRSDKDAVELVEENKRVMMIGGVNVPVCNLPKTLTTQAGHLMADGAPFAACYWDTPAGRVFSLRSRAVGGMDVQFIAKQYGGGGHEHAAGFRVPFDQLRERGLL